MLKQNRNAVVVAVAAVVAVVETMAVVAVVETMAAVVETNEQQPYQQQTSTKIHQRLKLKIRRFVMRTKTLAALVFTVVGCCCCCCCCC